MCGIKLDVICIYQNSIRTWMAEGAICKVQFSHAVQSFAFKRINYYITGQEETCISEIFQKVKGKIRG